MRVDAPVQAKLSLLPPEVFLVCWIRCSFTSWTHGMFPLFAGRQERVETIAAALQGQMDDEEDAEEAQTQLPESEKVP